MTGTAYPDVPGSRRALLSPLLCDTGGGRLVYFCPGCDREHAISVDPRDTGDKWTWNSNAGAPTFRPSVHYLRDTPQGRITVCHSWVTAGRIQFLGDSRHALAGQTVDMVALDEELWGS
jgi:hypothetical protein